MILKKKVQQPDEIIINKAQQVYKYLIAFYGLPVWRKATSPLDEMISTILSQNTNDSNRDAAYKNLHHLYPTWESVRDAPTAQIVAAIRTAGLGNQKAVRIQNILRQITAENGALDLSFLAEMPSAQVRSWLLKFKGIGPKTTAIVMQFSLGHSAFAVDTHIYRVSGRLGLRPPTMNVEQTHKWMEKIFKPDQYGTGHLNLIRLGREICMARKPACPGCPLRSFCNYYQNEYLSI